MVMERRRKLGARVDAAIGGRGIADRGLRSFSPSAGDVPKAMVTTYPKSSDILAYWTWTTHLLTESRRGKSGSSPSSVLLSILPLREYQLGAVYVRCFV